MSRKYNIGIFEEEEKFISAIRLLNEKGIPVYEVFTPYPVHEVFHLMKRSSRLPLAAYFFGLTGMVATIAFLYYTSVISWPIVYGGKPFNSFPSFIVVTIVITILTVTILSLALFSARSKLVPGRDNTVFYNGATDDKFIIAVEAEKEGTTGAVSLMRECGALEIIEKEFEKVLA